ncbi:MAG: FimV/HubP family polar landmark protein [Mariprofundaceae bacterium]|nr:FimV/HubP family polar landmark protein [Mariprofundaceae bacterium]
MQHKLQVFLIQLCALCMFVGSSYAVSLGDIKIKSHLGEYFDAEVPLRLSANESVSDVQVEMASPADYRILEVYREAGLNAIRLDVKGDQQDGKIVLNSTSILNSPFFNIILKVQLGRATHFKTYGVFLDPASTKSAAPVKPRVESGSAWVEASKNKVEDSVPTPAPLSPSLAAPSLAVPPISLPALPVATAPKNILVKPTKTAAVMADEKNNMTNAQEVEAAAEEVLPTPVPKVDPQIQPIEKQALFPPAEKPVAKAILPHEERLQRSEEELEMSDPFSRLFDEDFVRKKEVYNDSLLSIDDDPLLKADVNEPVIVAENVMPTPKVEKLTFKAQNRQPITTPVPRQPIAAAPAPNYTPRAGGETYGPIRKGETLFTVARAVQHRFSQPTRQVMAAIYKRNLAAFEQSNMNFMNVGIVLQIPTKSEVAATTLSEAKQMFEQHSRHFSAPASGAASFSKKVMTLSGSANRNVDTQANVGMPHGANNVLVEENKFLKTELAQANETIKSLHDTPENIALRATIEQLTIEVDSLQFKIKQLRAEIDKAKAEPQSEIVISDTMWYIAGGIVLFLLLLAIGVFVFMKRSSSSPAHPATTDHEAVAPSPAAPSTPHAQEAFAGLPKDSDSSDDVPEISDFDFPTEVESDNLETGDFDNIDTASFEGETATSDMSNLDFENFDHSNDGQMPDITDEDTSEIEAFQDEVEDEPDPDVDYLAEADVYQRYGMDDEAIHQINMAIRQRANNVEAHIKLVQYLSGADHADELGNATDAARKVLMGADLIKFESSLGDVDVVESAASNDIGTSTGSFDSDDSFDDLTATVAMNLSDIQENTDLLTEKAAEENVNLSDYGFDSMSMDEMDVDFDDSGSDLTDALDAEDDGLSFDSLDLGDSITGSNELDFSSDMNMDSFEDATEESTESGSASLDFDEKTLSIETLSESSIDFSGDLSSENDVNVGDPKSGDVVDSISSLEFDFGSLSDADNDDDDVDKSFDGMSDSLSLSIGDDSQMDTAGFSITTDASDDSEEDSFDFQGLDDTSDDSDDLGLSIDSDFDTSDDDDGFGLSEVDLSENDGTESVGNFDLGDLSSDDSDDDFGLSEMDLSEDDGVEEASDFDFGDLSSDQADDGFSLSEVDLSEDDTTESAGDFDLGSLSPNDSDDDFGLSEMDLSKDDGVEEASDFDFSDLSSDQADDGFSLSEVDLSEDDATESTGDFDLGVLSSDHSDDGFGLSEMDLSKGDGAKEASDFDFGDFDETDDFNVAQVEESVVESLEASTLVESSDNAMMQTSESSDFDLSSLLVSEEEETTVDSNAGFDDLGFDTLDDVPKATANESSTLDSVDDDLDSINSLLGFQDDVNTGATQDLKPTAIDALDSLMNKKEDDFSFDSDAIRDEVNKDFDLSSLGLDELESMLEDDQLDISSEIVDEEPLVHEEEMENEDIYNLLGTLSGGIVEQEDFGKARDASEKMAEEKALSKMGLDSLSVNESLTETQSEQDSFSLTQELDDLLHSFGDSSGQASPEAAYDQILSDSSLHLDSARSYLAQADFDEAKKEFVLASDDPETRQEALLGLADIARLEGDSDQADALLGGINPLQAAEDHVTELQMKIDMILAGQPQGENLESLAVASTEAGDHMKAEEYNTLSENLMKAIHIYEEMKFTS